MKYGEGAMGVATMSKPKIGIYDLASPDKSIINDMQQALPEYEVIHALKQGGETLDILHGFVDQGCKVIVIVSDIAGEKMRSIKQSVSIPVIDMAPPSKQNQVPSSGKVSFEAVVKAAKRAIYSERSKD